MELYIKDMIDVVSKIAGVLGLFVAIFVAWYEIKKNRDQRSTENQKQRDQKERELKDIRLTTETNEARFWLDLRKIFSEHDEVHLNLRPKGEWYKSKTKPTAEEIPKIEAYMGLFEHCGIMLGKKLIDWRTFKKIYAYRVKNILKNPVVVREKLVRRFWGWKDFIELVRELGYEKLIIETAGGWLNSSDGKTWLDGKEGKNWLATEEGKNWLIAVDQNPG